MALSRLQLLKPPPPSLYHSPPSPLLLSFPFPRVAPPPRRLVCSKSDSAAPGQCPWIPESYHRQWFPLSSFLVDLISVSFSFFGKKMKQDWGSGESCPWAIFFVISTNFGLSSSPPLWRNGNRLRRGARNMSSLIAFVVREKCNIGSMFQGIAAQTDRPCWKQKPRSASSRSGFLMVNVQTYGGGLWHKWFGRDQKLAQRVVLKLAMVLMHKLVKVRRAFSHVPMLAIHLESQH
uniref:aspartyl aminopeptidase n=1 Tax=Elaeis guineensis var. tenera TaxID=51953 RepID=A0A8N4F0N9_ELAGV|nr:aspartyl aminopeptidase 4 [Elaeis guineensis]XP_029118356.1 aspartyl aminopeptidase 4 [Elaeis guineensis]